MASGSFASGQHPQPPPQSHQPPQQQPQQQQQPYAMDLGLGYPSDAAAAAAMGEAYHAQGNMFGRLDYQAQAEEHRPPQRRRRQQGSNGGNAPGQVAPQASMGAPNKQPQPQHMGQFGILAPTPVPVAHPHGSMAPTMGQQTLHFAPTMPAGSGVGTADAAAAAPVAHGKLGGRIVVDPPDLQAWREKLFNVDEMIVLTQEQ